MRVLILILAAVVVGLAVSIVVFVDQRQAHVQRMGPLLEVGALLADARGGEEAGVPPGQDRHVAEVPRRAGAPPAAFAVPYLLIRRTLADARLQPYEGDEAGVAYEHKVTEHGWFPLMAPEVPDALDRIWVIRSIRQEKITVSNQEWLAWRVDLIDPALPEGKDTVVAWLHEKNRDPRVRASEVVPRGRDVGVRPWKWAPNERRRRHPRRPEPLRRALHAHRPAHDGWSSLGYLRFKVLPEPGPARAARVRLREPDARCGVPASTCPLLFPREPDPANQTCSVVREGRRRAASLRSGPERIGTYHDGLRQGACAYRRLTRSVNDAQHTGRRLRRRRETDTVLYATQLLRHAHGHERCGSTRSGRVG